MFPQDSLVIIAITHYCVKKRISGLNDGPYLETDRWFLTILSMETSMTPMKLCADLQNQSLGRTINIKIARLTPVFIASQEDSFLIFDGLLQGIVLPSEGEE